MANYPRKGMIRRHDKGMCQVCRKEKAAYRIDVEYTWMRGDDEVVRACPTCAKLPAEQIRKTGVQPNAKTEPS